MKWLPSVIALLLGLLGGYFLFGSKANPVGDKGAAPVESPAVRSDGPVGEVQLSEAELAVAEKYGVTIDWVQSLEGQNQFEQIGQLHARLKTARAADFPVIMDALGNAPGQMSWISRSLLATKWAATDPQGMLTYLNGESSMERWGLHNMLFGAWAQTDSSAALAAAKGLEGQRERNAAMQAIVAALAAESPARALEIADAEISTGRRNPWLYSNIFRQWAQRDPAAARQAALSMEDSPMKVQALSGALQEWMQREPMEALSWLDSLPMDGTIYNSRKEVIRQLLNRDFDTAKQYIEAEDDPLTRRDILSSVHFSNFVWSKDYEEMQAMFDWVGSVASGEMYDRKVGDVIGAMAEVDPGRAMDFVFQMSPGNARMNALGSLGGLLAERDPAEALAFVEGLAYEDEKQRALGNMGWRFSKQGVEAAGALIAASEDPLVQRQLASQMAREWSKYDRESAMQWIETLSDDDAKSNAVREVLENWIQSEPLDALRYVENEMPEEKMSSALNSAFSNWARQDPALAAEWLEQLPPAMEGKEKDIYNQVARAYVRHDPMAASEWVASLDEGPERDSSVQTLVQNISKTDPEAAFIWAATVGDDNTRKNSLSQTVREWVKSDPDAAYGAVKDAKIEAVEKESLFKLIEEQRK